MKALKTIVLLFVFVISSNAFGQNLKGVKEYCLLPFYSDEAKGFKKFLPLEHDIVQQIAWSIPELKHVSRIGWEYNFALVDISYNYYRNYEDTFNSQYYGTIDIRVYRYAIIRGSDDVVNALVFVDETYFVMTNPTNEMVKQESEQTISHLITSFGKQFYEDN